MTGQPRAIRLLYTFQDRYVAAAIRRAIDVTLWSSLPVVPEDAVSHRLIFPRHDERTLLIYSRHWNRVNTRDFFIEANAAVEREEPSVDLRVLVVPPSHPSVGFLQYLQDNGAGLVDPWNIISFLAAGAKRPLRLRKLPDGAALGREIAASISHGDRAGFLARATLMETLIPWLHKLKGER